MEMDAVQSENKNLLSLSLTLLGISFFIVGLGQPERSTLLGLLSASCGYALFFAALRIIQRTSHRFFVGAFWFFGVQLIHLSWMSSTEFQGYYILFVYMGLCLILGLQFGAMTLLIPREGAIGVRRMLLVASVWTLMEWMRVFPFCGFTWNPVGMALSSSVIAMQFASVFGVLGLSFWVIFTNLAALNWIRSRRHRRAGALFLAIAAAPYAFGVFHIHQKTTIAAAPTVHAALVQTHLLPSHKIPYPDRQDDYISPLEQWKSIVAALKEKRSWELIVLPEGTVRYQSDLPAYWLKEVLLVLVEAYGSDVYLSLPPLRAPFAERRYAQGGWHWCVSNLFWCQALANICRAELVIGLDHFESATEHNYNSAFHFVPDQITFERYDKQVLLPLAEYLPFEPLRKLAKRYGIHHFFSQGTHPVVFSGKIAMSPSICYEETFPEIMRSARKKRAGLFINLTNDNYFPKTQLHAQHYFHARLRAVENGIPLARACNTGVTAVVDCFGRETASLALGSEAGKCMVLSADIRTDCCKTFFSFWGQRGIIILSLVICLFEYANLKRSHKNIIPLQ